MGTLTVKLYKGPLELGSGTATDGGSNASITSYTANLSRAAFPRAVNVVVTQAGTHVGRSWQARVTADNGSGTLTLSRPCPFI